MRLSLPDPLMMALRALPKALVAVIGLVTLTSDSGWLRAMAALLVISVILTPWPSWWTYVRTGQYPGPKRDPRFSEPGNYRVLLSETGPRPINVIKALRQISDLGLAEAKALTDTATTTGSASILESVSSTSAERAVALLREAGATADVLEMPLPQA